MSDRFPPAEFPKRNIEPVNNKLADALTDNMGSIIDIAKDIVEIQAMKVKSEAVLAKMEKDKEMLLAEAEAYVKKKNSDNALTIGKMQVAREMLKDFYIQKNTSGVSAEEFAAVLKAIYDTPDLA